MDDMLGLVDSSFKYILLLFNIMTLVVVYLHKNKQKRTKQHHVLFVIAHPDDQAMFFRPSITSITKDYFVHLLCLTGGWTTRQTQLKSSAQRLKLHKYSCIQNEKLKDSMTVEWPLQQIREVVLKYVNQNNIKAIFTFDSNGVSNHPNHKAIYNALAELHCPSGQLKILKKKQSKLTEEDKLKIEQIKNTSIKIYHLRSVNILRKYTGFLEFFIAIVRDFSWINLNLADAYRAMAVHKSQFVWYRKLWVFFSQYSYINVFWMTRMKKGIEDNQSTIEVQTKKDR